LWRGTEHARFGITSQGTDQPEPKALRFVGPSREDLRSFPHEVQQAIGHALYLAQTGDKHPAAKPLKGYRGAGVLEVVEDFAGDTFRAVYTVRFRDAVYVLHAFQKKSKTGIKTPRRELDLIDERLRQAERHYRQTLEDRGR
jgi:phage-related protein